jgi:integrase
LSWGTLGANLTTMSDDVPLRLPRYVFRRSNGSFRYKRNVPEHLRPHIGKATLYRQLGDSYREAMQALPLVHARIEALLNDEADKSDTPKAAREIGQRVERLRTDMKSVFGKQRLKYTPLTDITRQDANDLRDHLLSRVSANSAVRMLGVVRTAINHVIVEHSLTIPNVFTNLKIKGAGATKHDRLPLSDDQVVTLETAFSSDDIAWALYVTLRDTGARVSEVSGPRVKDCDLGQQCLHLTATPWRSLKTNNSERSVPLSHTAAAALAKLAQGKDPEAPLFPNYAKDRGAFEINGHEGFPACSSLQKLSHDRESMQTAHKTLRQNRLRHL